jgi:hypothetical protein
MRTTLSQNPENDRLAELAEKLARVIVAHLEEELKVGQSNENK